MAKRKKRKKGSATMPTQPQALQPTASQPGLTEQKTQLHQLIKTLEDVRGSRVIVYWLSDGAKISAAVEVPLFDQLQTLGHQKRIDLMVFTRGGDTEAPWRIVSMIREYCDHFAVLVPHRCHSAGTVLALGADEIIMTALGALGPIDPSRTHPLLPRRQGADEPEPISVQDMRHAMQFIHEAGGSGKRGMPYTPEAMAQIFTALFDKIHPLAIGAIEQSYALAKLVAKQCLGTHMRSRKDQKRIEKIVDRLCDAYKSHVYQISRSEAREIGLKVVDAAPGMEEALLNLYKFCAARPVPLFEGIPSAGSVVQMQIAWLDSRDRNFRAVANCAVGPNGELKHQGDAWVAY